MQQALLGGGCFWCVEAVFLQLKGVDKVVSGYAGGIVQNPNYEQVLEALKNVEDPDLKKDLVTLGMITDLVVEGKNVSFTVPVVEPAAIVIGEADIE